MWFVKNEYDFKFYSKVMQSFSMKGVIFVSEIIFPMWGISNKEGLDLE